jgi:hypothetical protein
VAPPGNQVATEKTNIDLQHRESPVYSTTTHLAFLASPSQTVPTGPTDHQRGEFIPRKREEWGLPRPASRITPVGHTSPPRALRGIFFWLRDLATSLAPREQGVDREGSKCLISLVGRTGPPIQSTTYVVLASTPFRAKSVLSLFLEIGRVRLSGSSSVAFEFISCENIGRKIPKFLIHKLVGIFGRFRVRTRYRARCVKYPPYVFEDHL